MNGEPAPAFHGTVLCDLVSLELYDSGKAADRLRFQVHAAISNFMIERTERSMGMVLAKPTIS